MSVNILAWCSCHLSRCTECHRLLMVPWTWGWELWLHLLMLHTRGTVSPVEVAGRCLPLALPQHVSLPSGLFFISLCFSSVVTGAQLSACRAVTTLSPFITPTAFSLLVWSTQNDPNSDLRREALHIPKYHQGWSGPAPCPAWSCPCGTHRQWSSSGAPAPAPRESAGPLSQPGERS